MREQIVKVRLFWSLVVFSAQAYHPFVCNECVRLSIWVGPDLSNHDVNSKIKFLSINKKRIGKIFLADVTLGERVLGNVFERLHKEDTAALSSPMRLHNKCFVFM